ncbi:hypothetical protein QLQ12_13150 [Actinoplanes sp. NEAU-A12]|uniref:Alpha/beta hydrolase n=1 Tax=Actinoplanes sandaracinus TaxID=3045177 RepID=A0ABT6WIJ3_9ACTN|nr:hypothetical protein [Actinoplanes sandaracinus]MDI6099544.1 hypothetical protein [Actinoplanes sandaracinus]
MIRRLAALLLVLVSVAGLSPGVATAAPTATHHTGVLRDGGTWVADVPARWNGTLVLYSHGFGALEAIDAPDPEVQRAMLDRGYALAGSSYDPNGSLWALNSATRDQFETLAAVTAIIGEPRVTLALGSSMGGLVSGQEAQLGGRRLDGAVSICGLMGGGINLNNYQLDGTYALNRLLRPDRPVKLVGYASPAEGAAAAAELAASASAARTTAEGRARVALATALLNMPTWSDSQASPPRDAEGIAAAQHEWLVGTLPFIMPARHFIERSAGGNASWNAGVDYAALLERSAHRDTVGSLYRAAGLNLRADLADLTRHADITPDKPAVRHLARTSTLSGHLDVPHLTMHTLYDQLAPVEYQEQYARRVRAAGDQRLLRQAYVNRRGHCAFTPSEIIAAVRAVEHRVRTGYWGPAATTRRLQADAVGLGLGDTPAFIDHRPGPFVNDRIT